MRAIFRLRALLIASSLLGVGAIGANAHAQELRGLVVMPDGATPAPGVVTVLVHATIKDSIVARGVTNERGRFTLKLPAGASTRLRLLRIGFDPMEAGTYSLAQDEVMNASFTLHDIRIKLATYDVKVASRCDVRPNGAQLVAQLFQQARTALIASTSALSGTATARAINYERRQDRRNALLNPINRVVKVDATLKPYASIGADSLDKVGYVVPDGNDNMYYAPDAEVLLSDKFLAQHCLQLVNGVDSLAGFIGIGFKPVANRRNRVDVQGTLWLDRATSELQFLEFLFTPVPDYLKGERIGGRVDYAQLPNGGWFVSNWNIRMPVLTSVPPGPLTRGTISTSEGIVVSALQIAGGTVQEIRLDDRVLYLNSAARFAGARPGDRTWTSASTTSMVPGSDSGTVRSFCGSQVTFEHEGLITGRVFDETHQPFSGALVTGRWKEQFSLMATSGSLSVSWQNFQVSTTTSSMGEYWLCGVPVRRMTTVFATRTATEKSRRQSFVRVTEDLPIAQLDLTLDPPAGKVPDAGKTGRK